VKTDLQTLREEVAVHVDAKLRGKIQESKGPFNEPLRIAARCRGTASSSNFLSSFVLESWWKNRRTSGILLLCHDDLSLRMVSDAVDKAKRRHDGFKCVRQGVEVTADEAADESNRPPHDRL
jgi:hypothetical protein